MKIKQIKIKGERVIRRLNGHSVIVILPEKRITPEQAQLRIKKLMKIEL